VKTLAVSAITQKGASSHSLAELQLLLMKNKNAYLIYVLINETCLLIADNACSLFESPALNLYARETVESD
jgi:hypothetical protein